MRFKALQPIARTAACLTVVAGTALVAGTATSASAAVPGPLAAAGTTTTTTGYYTCYANLSEIKDIPLQLTAELTSNYDDDASPSTNANSDDLDLKVTIPGTYLSQIKNYNSGLIDVTIDTIDTASTSNSGGIYNLALSYGANSQTSAFNESWTGPVTVGSTDIDINLTGINAPSIPVGSGPTQPVRLPDDSNAADPWAGSTSTGIPAGHKIAFTFSANISGTNHVAVTGWPAGSFSNREVLFRCGVKDPSNDNPGPDNRNGDGVYVGTADLNGAVIKNIDVF